MKSRNRKECHICYVPMEATICKEWLCVECKRNRWRTNREKRIIRGTVKPVEEKKLKAWAIVTAAIKSGELVRLPCTICGDPKSEWHHPDYSKPLYVIWLCRKHHAQAHREEKKLNKSTTE